MKSSRRALFGLLVAFVIAGPMPVAAQSPGPATGEPAITIQGHWVIEVRNPDGTLATRRELKNAYVGGDVMARLLTFTDQVRTIDDFTDLGGWHIVLDGHPLQVCTPFPPHRWLIGDEASLIGSCALSQPNFTVFQVSDSALTMAGSVVALNSTDIVRVKTVAVVSHESIGAGTARNFTLRDLAGADWIHVEKGQEIQISVTLSFCCAPLPL